MTTNFHKTACIFFLLFPTLAFSEAAEKKICINLYIITKGAASYSESEVFEKQKKIAFKQISQTQFAFDKNSVRNCPKIKLLKSKVKRISWDEALKLSQPVDKDINEHQGEYLLRKLQKAFYELEGVTKNIEKKQNIKYQSFLELYQGKIIAEADIALNKYSDYLVRNNDDSLNSKDYEIKIKKAIDEIKLKLESSSKEGNLNVIIKAKERLSAYNKIDESTASSWKEGMLTLWNDIEAQNTSIELKNLLKHHRADNQCMDVYIIPAAKSPSTYLKEFEKNGKWTKRDGAAISAKNFPRTTAGKGDAILLTYNSKSSEFRLAHELGHLLLIDVPNAHLDKKETDLMHEFSKGGYYLNEMECDAFNLNMKIL